MSNFDQENTATREALAILQGQMGTIMEHLQTQRDNDALVNQDDATLVTYVADTMLVVMDPTNSIVLPATASQPLAHAGHSKLVVSYPMGMPNSYNPKFSTRNPFMSYQSFVVVPAAFPWGIHNPYYA